MTSQVRWSWRVAAAVVVRVGVCGEGGSCTRISGDGAKSEAPSFHEGAEALVREHD
jgi:hypothetical protein